MPRDYSFGIIPVRKNKDGICRLLLVGVRNQISGIMQWGFPKGHPEEGESPLETAVRECWEETGLKVGKPHIERSYSCSYEVEKDNVRKLKTVTYFISEISDDVVTIDPREIDSYAWATLSEAYTMITRDNLRRMLEDARADIERLVNL